MTIRKRRGIEAIPCAFGQMNYHILTFRAMVCIIFPDNRSAATADFPEGYFLQRGGDPIVSYEGLFQYTLVIIGIIGTVLSLTALILRIHRRK